MTTTMNAAPRIALAPMLPEPDDRDHAVSTSDVSEAYAKATSRELMPWQRETHGPATATVDDKWSAREVAIVKPRQQGATELGLLRMLFGLVTHDERQLYTAHSQDEAHNSFVRLIEMIRNYPALDSRVRSITRSRGSECITLRSGAFASFRTRGGANLRISELDLSVNDDAEMLTDAMYVDIALMHTVSKNPQTWFIGTPPTEPLRTRVDPQSMHDAGRPLTRLRNAALSGEDRTLLYIEYSADDTRDDDGRLLVDTSSDAVALAANPAAGHIIDPSIFARERQMMPRAMYESQRLGIGYWPSLDDKAEQ
ncbi:MAG: hypothetical protein WBF79_00630 [Rhodococcus sp. (in: high G+C Gram-positive bacteria)]